VNSVDVELGLVALAAMFSPTTLTFSVLSLVLSDRPRRTGLLFYLGAFGTTLAIGIVAAFVLGDAAAAPEPSTPKTWVAIVDVVAAVWLLAFVFVRMRRPPDPKRISDMVAQMSKVSDSPWIAIIGAGAALGNAGGFIPLALKEISELNPTSGEYIVLWLAFALIALLPLAVALIALTVNRPWAERILHSARSWLERRARIFAAVILVLLAAALLRNGIAGLTS
jgi:hypothetical protein